VIRIQDSLEETTKIKLHALCKQVRKILPARCGRFQADFGDAPDRNRDEINHPANLVYDKWEDLRGLSKVGEMNLYSLI
jgi:hypothetical protein